MGSMDWARRGTRKELLATAFLVAMTLTNVVSAVKLADFLRNGYQDFTIFYTAGRMVRTGQVHAFYDLSAQYREQLQFAPNVHIREAALPYNHPPFEALLFVPFTFLPYFPAYLLWNFLNVLMIAASLILLQRQFTEIGNLPIAFLVLAATGFTPVALAFTQGQDSILLLFLCVIAFVAIDRGHEAAAGATLAMGLFKFHLVLPLVFLLAMRRWRLLLGFAPVAALLGAISLAMVGWKGLVGYAQFLFRLENTGAGGAIVGAKMPNLRGIVEYLAGAHGRVSVMPITIACSVAVLVIAWRRMRVMRDSVRATLILATAAAIFVSYHTFIYDLSLLLPAVLLLFAAPAPESGGQFQTDIFLLIGLYVAPLFESPWPRANQFCWPVVIALWFFWKFGQGRFAEAAAGTARERTSTTISMGR